jgi:DNA-binding MarR family transcriptional regulator
MNVIDLIIDLKYKCSESERDIMKKVDLDYSEYQAINKIDPKHNISCNEIAGIINLSVSRTSRVIDKLVRKNILKREVYNPDKRTKLVSLTEKGIKVKKEINKHKSSCEKKISGAFNEKELNEIKRNITRLVNVL